MAAYYQEASRAGRDGSPAKHVLFTSVTDVVDLLEWTHGDYADHAAGQEFALGLCLDLIDVLIDETTCRHELFERKLGGGEVAPTCAQADSSCMCDNCRRRQTLECHGQASLERVVLYLQQWAPAFVRVFDLCYRDDLGGAACLRAFLAQWFRSADGPVPRWTRGPLFLYALRYGALQLRFEAAGDPHVDSVDGDTDTSRRSRRWRVLAVANRHLLFSSTRRPVQLASITLSRERWDASQAAPDEFNAIANAMADALELHDGDGTVEMVPHSAASVDDDVEEAAPV